MPQPITKKSFKYQLACTGMGCPARFTCSHFFALNNKAHSKEVIRPPFKRTDTGKFVSCDLHLPVAL